MNKPQQEKPPVNEAQVQALLQALQNQRNHALNALAQVESTLALASARIQELEKRVADLSADKQAETA